jgi:hypothetical protein
LGACEIDLVDLFLDGRGVVGQPLAVALVHQEFVVVDSQNLAHGEFHVVERIGILVDGARSDVDFHDPRREARGRSAILEQRTLHDADQRPGRPA